MKTKFVRPDDAMWTRLVETLSCDVYHQPAYLKASAAHEGGDAFAFYAENSDGVLFTPLLRRSIPGNEYADVTTPYGYPAPLWTASDPTPHWSAFADALREQGVVSAFLRLHPMISPPEPSHVGVFETSAIVEHGPTVWLRRSPDRGQRWSETRPDHRSDIRRLQRQGYTLSLHDPCDDEAFESFRSIYLETMERVNATPFYRFSDAYFRTWQTDLSTSAVIAIVSDPNGEPAASGLFTLSDRWMQFHLSGTAADHRDVAPTKLMLHHLALNPTADGPPILHLGGGLGAARDSLFKFKAGFSSNRATFRSLRLICDAEAYSALCSDAETMPPLEEGFFPAYRKPD